MGFADDCHSVMQLLLDLGPLSAAEADASLRWGARKVDRVMAALAASGRIAPLPAVRVGGSRVTRYSIKGF